ncbi:hypothetical protein CABS01_05662 [Colletotrichum abscissum]|nr:uncharacterized protein CABS01_05662 [Colletotrichum abscissum]KAK1521157.1 hypothetical protein CABS01_05662 [Colletotrichum abscissum]
MASAMYLRLGRQALLPRSSDSQPARAKQAPQGSWLLRCGSGNLRQPYLTSKTLSKEAAWAVAAQRCSAEQSRAEQQRCAGGHTFPLEAAEADTQTQAAPWTCSETKSTAKTSSTSTSTQQHPAHPSTVPPPSSHLPHHTDRDFLARTEAPSLPFAPLSSSPAVTDEQQQSLSAFKLNFCHLHPPPPKLPSTTPPTSTQHRNSLVR